MLDDADLSALAAAGNARTGVVGPARSEQAVSDVPKSAASESFVEILVERLRGIRRVRSEACHGMAVA